MKLKEVQNDCNFIRNLELDELPSNYGAFKSTVEIDGLQAKMAVVTEVHKSLTGSTGDRSMLVE